jgi:hypothetical protein
MSSYSSERVYVSSQLHRWIELQHIDDEYEPRPKDKPWKWRGMESMESQKAGFPPFPHPLEIPAGFPHYHGNGDDYH